MTNSRELPLTLKRLMILAGVSALFYILNRLILTDVLSEVGFLKNYLGDMLALPVYLPASLYLAWRLRVIPEDAMLHFTHIFSAVIIFSILFEGIVPVLDTTTTRDGYDVLAYLAGGILVYLVGSPRILRRTSNLQD